MMRTIRINQNTFVNSLLDGRKFLPFFLLLFISPHLITAHTSFRLRLSAFPDIYRLNVCYNTGCLTNKRERGFMIRDRIINFLSAHSDINTALPLQQSETESYKDLNELAGIVAAITGCSVCSEITVTSDINGRLYLGFGRSQHTDPETCFFRSAFKVPVSVDSYTPEILIVTDPRSLTVTAEYHAGTADNTSRNSVMFDKEALDSILINDGSLLTASAPAGYPDGRTSTAYRPEHVRMDGVLENADIKLIPEHDVFLDRVRHIRNAINCSGSLLKKAVTARKAVFTLNAETAKDESFLLKTLTGLIYDRLSEPDSECHFYASYTAPDSADEGSLKPQLFVSFTPEKLFSIKSRSISCDALAGSVSAEDAATLLHDRKNLTENRIVADYVSSKLSGICLDVRQSEQKLRKLSYITHLLVEISGTHKDTPDPSEMIKLLHPTPATLGYPAAEALKILDECGALISGDYAGIGGIRHHDESTALVLLRSVTLTADSITLYGGAGIMGESEPESEWKETGLKMTAVLRRISNENTVRMLLDKINCNQYSIR